MVRIPSAQCALLMADLHQSPSGLGQVATALYSRTLLTMTNSSLDFLNILGSSLDSLHFSGLTISPPNSLQIFALASAVTILLVNLPILWILKSKCEATVINLFILLDVSICLLQPVTVLYSAELWLFRRPITPALCGIATTTSFYFSLLNRLIPVGIVTYRYVFVCRSHWVHTGPQRRNFNTVLAITLATIPLLLATGSYYYRDKYLHYLSCLDRYLPPLTAFKLVGTSLPGAMITTWQQLLAASTSTSSSLSTTPSTSSPSSSSSPTCS